MAELFVELYGEDLPHWAQVEGVTNLPLLLRDSLSQKNFLEDSAKTFSYTTARRLVVWIEGILSESKPQEIEIRGPREGANEKALEGFLRKAGFSSTEDQGVELRETPKGKFWFATKLVPPSSAEKEVPEAVVETLHAMRWKKSMRWDASGFRWPRPLRRYTILLNEAPLQLPRSEDLPPFEGGTNEIMIDEELVAVSSASQSIKILRDSKIEIGFQSEEGKILETAIFSVLAGSFFAFDRAVRTVERPFNLIIYPKAKKLPESFVPIILNYHLSTRKTYGRNTRADPEGGYYYLCSLPGGLGYQDRGEWEERVTRQVEKVAQSRLDDALFYWERDKALGLEGLYEQLNKIAFHEKLGSLRMRADRIANLTKRIASRWHLQIAREFRQLNEEELGHIYKVAQYSLCDIGSGTVNEIPELQGQVGAELFAADKNFASYADCPSAAHLNFVINEEKFYIEEFSISLASALDYLVGYMAAGEHSTGSRDPYALRSCATIICRNMTIFNPNIPNLEELINTALTQYKEDGVIVANSEVNLKLKADIMKFLKARLEYYLQHEKGIPYDITRAVMNATGDSLATKHFMGIHYAAKVIHGKFFSGDASSGKKLILAWRRAQGLLKESNLKPNLFEHALSEQGQKFKAKLEQQAEKSLERLTVPEEHVKILTELSDSVSEFLDAEKVLVGTEQEQQARLALLDRFIQVVKRVADLDYIEGGDITARKDSARLNQG